MIIPTQAGGLLRNTTDTFSSLSMIQSYRSRSGHMSFEFLFCHLSKNMTQKITHEKAYHLRDILDKFELLGANSKVLDIGAAPGGWSQLIAEELYPSPKEKNINSENEIDIYALDLGFEAKAVETYGLLVSVDTSQFQPVHDSASQIIGDFRSLQTKSEIIEICSKFDLIVADTYPGKGFVILENQMTKDLVSFAQSFLAPNGSLIVPYTNSDSLKILEGFFENVVTFKSTGKAKHKYFVCLKPKI